jgi:glycosyltransferase involved in cell wall biosynthesis
MVRRFAPRAKLIYDTVDLHFLRMKREALLHGLDSKNVERYQKIESEAANQADLTFVVSSTEIPILSEVSPAANIQILSNIHSLAKQTAPFQSRDGILFIGGFQHPPNIDAVHYFAKSVFPIVQKSLPNIKFRIVGSWTPEEIKSYHGNDIEILGYVEDIVPILNQSRVMVAPLRYGAGVKGKINTAMSYGIPVVATEVAVEGMGMTHGRDVLVGQTPNELAKEIIRIYQDEILWNQVANEARATLIECFSRDKAIATFKQIIAQ